MSHRIRLRRPWTRTCRRAEPADRAARKRLEASQDETSQNETAPDGVNQSSWGTSVRCDVPDQQPWSADRLPPDRLPPDRLPQAGTTVSAEADSVSTAESSNNEPEPSERQETSASRHAVCRYERRFNSPSGLEGQRVRLAISGWSGTLVSIRLNDQPIPIGDSEQQAEPVTVGPDPALESPPTRGGLWDLTDSLAPSNRLAVELAGEPGTASEPRLTGEVELRISPDG